MKVLILANGTGGGHMAAAYALQEAFEAQGHEATVLDPFSLLGEVRQVTVSTPVTTSVQLVVSMALQSEAQASSPV